MANGARVHVRGCVGALACLLAASNALAQSTDIGSVTLPMPVADVARPSATRGLAALHSFWYEEARTEFRRARQADGDAVLPYWGEALTFVLGLPGQAGSDDTSAARSVLEQFGPSRAARASRARTVVERRYLEAVEELIGHGDVWTRQRAFSATMGDILRDYPDDPEAGAFYALSILASRPMSQWDLFTRVRAAAIAGELFRKHSRHPGAAHYFIHAVDDPTLAPLGLAIARAYADIAPASPHALHMASHIFLALGRWADVSASNAASYTASRAGAMNHQHGASGASVHALAWLHYAELQQGHRRDARNALDSLSRAASAVPALLPELLRMQVIHARDAGEWIGSIPQREPLDLTTAYAVGLRAVALRDDSATQRALAGLRVIASGQQGVLARLAQWAEFEIQSRRHMASGRLDDATRTAGEAAQIEATTGPPTGPPLLKPARELLGEILLVRGRYADAAAEFDAALLRTPGRSPALLGRARSAAGLRDSATARRYYGILAEQWQSADSDTPGLQEVRISIGH